MRFYLMDRITEFNIGKSAQGIKNVTLSEDFFTDHFPRHPIMPGVLILEALAQLSGLLLEKSVESEFKISIKAFLTMMEKTKFRHVVEPGDVLVLKTEIQSLHEDSGKVKVKALAGNRVSAESDMIFVFRSFHDPALEEKRKKIEEFWLKGIQKA
ncbi:MAG: 3-hydroxyacyl-ACP dehydratase FabZ [Candidatus Wallbacteria bacterium]|nr:3-hydroxyacyl-ACP dehydratase FabZ [Candidatus Wallbacteria bacterium]